MAEVAPVGFVQVGWYCDHRGGLRYDEKKRKCLRENPHVEWKYKAGERKAQKNHDVVQAMHNLDHRHPDEPPACPQAVPVYRRLSDE